MDRGTSGLGTIGMNGQGIDVNELIETDLLLTVTDIVDVNASGQLLARAHTPAVVALRLDPIDPSPADLDGDCDTDHADMQRLFNDWGSSDSIADLDVDGVVDALDFLFLLAHWSRRAPGERLLQRRGRRGRRRRELHLLGQRRHHERNRPGGLRQRHDHVQ